MIEALEKARQRAEENERVIVGTLRAPMRVDALGPLNEALAIAYGTDVRIEGRGDWFFFTAPAGWESRPGVYVKDPEGATDDHEV